MCVCIYIYIYIYIYIVFFGPVKPELGVIPSGQENHSKAEHLKCVCVCVYTFIQSKYAWINSELLSIDYRISRNLISSVK